jgi:hypothetical protein
MNSKLIHNQDKLFKLYKLQTLNEIKEFFFYQNQHLLSNYDIFILNFNQSELKFNIKVLHNILYINNYFK